MKQRLNLSMAIVVVLTIYCGPVLAERKPEKPSDANVIVWGTVEEIVRSETDENTNYEVRIRVESVERSYRAVVGKLFSVRCFQRKASAPRVPAASGHTAVPKVGQRIRAWVNRHKDGTNHGIYPDWFHTRRTQRATTRGVRLGEVERRSPGVRRQQTQSPDRFTGSLQDRRFRRSRRGPETPGSFPRTTETEYRILRPDRRRTSRGRELKHLENLTLCWARITDDDFRGLEGMTSLTHLDATSTGITDRSLKQIATYTSLRTLRLTSSRMPQRGSATSASSNSSR